ncbi:MAG TPA: hypothetical protein DF613_01165 [Lachnospiraceae bacterium]|nr:hypothetical protein [Lachnospiraceae bacterium]
MENYGLDITRLRAWSGYYANDAKVRASASGGGATAIAEAFIKNKSGFVFGAAFTRDFKDVVYKCIETREELSLLKGSKYVYSTKKESVPGGKETIFSIIEDKLKHGKSVLMIGLGCDIGALNLYLHRKRADIANLYTVELICNGPTYKEVQRQYIENIEKMYCAKVINFSMRYKKCGWTPFYIYAELDNGQKHIRTFYDSDYGYAFQNYKLRKCYNCQFRGEKHPADLALGDCWGMKLGMENFCKNGVSAFIAKTQKGVELVEDIDTLQFCLKEANVSSVIKNNPMYCNTAVDNGQWKKFDAIFKSKGLRTAVVQTKRAQACKAVNDWKNKEVVLWGIGKCFSENLPKVKEICGVRYICDNDESRKKSVDLQGMVYIPPHDLRRLKNIFVILMFENISYAFQVVRQLIDMGIFDFDIVYNWLQYADNTN